MNLFAGVQRQTKMDIALARSGLYFRRATAGDPSMMEIIEEGARVLCEYTEAVAARFICSRQRSFPMGGLFFRDSIYTHAFRRRLKKNLPGRSRNNCRTRT
jgi:hypothetical protein